MRGHPSQHISPLTTSMWQRLTARNALISVSLAKSGMNSPISDYHFVDLPTSKNFLINLISVNTNNGKIQIGLSSHRHKKVTQRGFQDCAFSLPFDLEMAGYPFLNQPHF